MTPGNYLYGFLQLPYYTMSTNGTYLQVHLQHHFNGYILDKIPGIKDLGWSVVAGAKMLSTTGQPDYYEAHIGMDNIGFSFVRLLRIDAVMSHQSGSTDWGVRLGIGLN